MSTDVLSSRALNRATLERQLLLRRSDRTILDAVDHLVGLQAQVPQNPYVALWSRLERFEPDELGQLLVDRKVVRIVVMRATIHLVTADDCLLLRPLVQPVLDGELTRHGEYGSTLRATDLEPVMAFAGPLLASRALTGGELRAALEVAFPDLDAAALAYACRNRLALLQVPPRGVWRRTGQVRSTTAEAWLGRPLAERPSIDALMVRYLAAFGPASVADASSWSRLTGLRDVFERLRPALPTFRDERGRELFDLPDAPRPDPSTPAPPRFLPEYDNALLSHGDRSRFLAEPGHRPRLFARSRPVKGTVLHDGMVRATWWLDEDGGTGSTALVVDHVDALAARARAAIEAEGRRLLALLAPSATTHDVRLRPVD
jgi:hypothetical protein